MTKTSNAGWRRILLGFLLAPLCPGLLTAIVSVPFLTGTTVSDPAELAMAARLVALSGLLGYPLAVILGVPLFILFRSRNWNGWLIYLAAGALMGAVVYLAFPLAGYSSKGLSGVLEIVGESAPLYLPLGMLAGTLATLAFWLIARPDR